MEALESRECLSTTVFATDNGHTLVILGNDRRMTFNLFDPFVVPLDRVFIANALLDGGAGLDTKVAATPNVTVLSCELPLHVAPPVGGGVLSPS